MHYMDANKTEGEKAWQQLHKNAASNIELPPNECLGYVTQQSDGEVPVMLGLWGICSTPS